MMSRINTQPECASRNMFSVGHAARRLAVAAVAIAVFAGLPGCASSPKSQAVKQLNENLDRELIASGLAEKADRARVSGNTEDAIGFYRESLDYSSRYPDVWNNLGMLLLEQQQFGKAINAFVQAGTLDPTDPRPPTNAGIASSRAGWEENAMRFYHEALNIQESYIPALRGAIRSADLLGTAQYEDLERVKTAMLAETNPQWREYFKGQRFLIESRLRSAREHRGPNID